MVPEKMIGTKLVPLNNLKEIQPDLYDKYSKKYFDHPERTKLLSRQIPKLDCLWNDVIHFLPLHPFHVYSAFKELGLKASPTLKFFRLPIDCFKDNRIAIYLYSKENYKGPGEPIDESEIRLVSVDEYEELKKIPAETLEYYAMEKAKGKKFGIFPYIPHLLCLGEVDFTNAELINWSVGEEIDG